MKVFFTTTPRLKEKYVDHVRGIYNAIKDLNHTHTSDYLVRVEIDDFYTMDDKSVPNYYDEILAGLKKSDVVVFEGSMHSIGVGMLIKEALDQGKGVVVLHMKGKVPFLLSGLKDDRLVIEEYTLDSIKNILKDSFEYLMEQVDTRFNFFISPQQQRFLDWVAKAKKVPRAVYLRRLINEAIKKNSEYEG